MPNIGYWLDRKYSNMEADVANRAVTADAAANQAAAQTKIGIPAAAEAARGAAEQSRAAAEQARAQATVGIPSEAGLRTQQSEGLRLSNRFGQGLEKNLFPYAESEMRSDPLKYLNMFSGGNTIFKRDGTAKVMKKGETRVTDETGNGHPRVDTVPAMLAEGEAVLNAGAAERMGRDEIKALNKQGLRDMKMGGVEPTMKKGGRIGPFTGVEHGYRSGTNFARTSPNNDAEYHPTEYSEPRDPEHDAEHMAQPLSSGGQGYGLRCGTAKVMKYADGTSDAGGHGSPDSPGAVNMAGTPGGRGRNMGAKFAGARGYANGIDRVPPESETELANFARQRDRNNIDEAMPAGTPVANEAAGQQGAVTPSRDSARLRQAFGLTAQGFAMGTEDVQAMQMRQDPDTVYAAEGDENILRRSLDAAKSFGGRAMEGLRGMGQAAPIEPAAAAPASAAEAITAARAEKLNAAAQAARTAMGEAPDALRGAAQTAAPAMEQAAAKAPVWQRPGQALARSVLENAPAAGRMASKLAGPAAFLAAPAYQAAQETNPEFYRDPNVPVSDKVTQGAVTGLRALGTAAGTVVGAGAGSLAGLPGTVVGGAGGAVAGKWLTDKLAPEKTDALRKWEADRAVEAGQAMNPHQLREPVNPAAKAEQQAAAPKLTLRGLATVGALMGHTGAAGVLRDLTDRESSATSAAAKAAKLSDVQIFDPATLDPKDPDKVIAGVERKDLSEQFNNQYMPMYAQQRQQANPNEKITPARLQAEAQLSYGLNRAAEEYGLTSGKGFNFTRPILPDRTEYIKDLPALTRIIGRERGENEWKEGIWDKGGIVVTDGVEKQVLPIEFLDKKWLNAPDLSLKVKSLIQQNSAKAGK